MQKIDLKLKKNHVFQFLLISILFIYGVADASGEIRIISLFHIHTKEELTILYKKDGKYIPEALKKLNWLLRDWRRNEAIEIDPKAIDIAWDIHTELRSQMPIHIICGYRAKETNDLLRTLRGGQAYKSQHIDGKAIDLSFPDIPIRRLRYSAMIHELGGVGYYPTSAIPFIHIDTGRVRSWPRMPHDELALLFPSGHSKHFSSDGRTLQPGDFLEARKRQPQLAQQVAQFFDQREQIKKSIMIASNEIPQLVSLGSVQKRPKDLASPMKISGIKKSEKNYRDQKNNYVPQLLSGPRLVERSTYFSKGPTNADRKKLTALISLNEPSHYQDAPPHLINKPHLLSRQKKKDEISTPDENPNKLSFDTPTTHLLVGSQMKHSKGRISPYDEKRTLPKFNADLWAFSPTFDNDHPDELSYQPFPILPLLTSTPSPDDPALARLIHPNIRKTLEMIDAEGNVPPMRFRLGTQTALLFFSQKFSGKVVDLSMIEPDTNENFLKSSGLIKRVVTTSHD